MALNIDRTLIDSFRPCNINRLWQEIIKTLAVCDARDDFETGRDLNPEARAEKIGGFAGLVYPERYRQELRVIYEARTGSRATLIERYIRGAHPDSDLWDSWIDPSTPDALDDVGVSPDSWRKVEAGIDA